MEFANTRLSGQPEISNKEASISLPCMKRQRPDIGPEATRIIQ
jgi:hypothetical protein